ncbi:hypothetical protein LSO9J_40046 [Candidatus Liberibacter solanacearum]
MDFFSLSVLNAILQAITMKIVDIYLIGKKFREKNKSYQSCCKFRWR